MAEKKMYRSWKRYDTLEKAYKAVYENMNGEIWKENFEDLAYLSWDNFKSYADIAWKNFQTKKALQVIPLNQYSREELTDFFFDLLINRQKNDVLQYISNLTFNPSRYRSYFEHPCILDFSEKDNPNILRECSVRQRAEEEKLLSRSVYLALRFAKLLKEAVRIVESGYSMDEVEDILGDEPFFKDGQKEIEEQAPLIIGQARFLWGEYLVWESQIKFEREMMERARNRLNRLLENGLAEKNLEARQEDAESAYKIAHGNLNGYEECRRFFDDLVKDNVSNYDAQYSPLTWVAIANIREKQNVQLKIPRNVERYPDISKGRMRFETKAGGRIRYDMGEYQASKSVDNIIAYYEKEGTAGNHRYGYELLELNIYMETFKIGLARNEEVAKAIWEMYFYLREQLGKALLIYDENRFVEIANSFGEIVFGE